MDDNFNDAQYINYVNNNLTQQQFRLALLPKRNGDMRVILYWGHKNSRDVQREMYKPQYKDNIKLIVLNPYCRKNYLLNTTG
tara:strand:- start:1035 stop:1280 length:246 start_codon:yes stop_codon:yes gene_type:complete